MYSLIIRLKPSALSETSSFVVPSVRITPDKIQLATDIHRATSPGTLTSIQGHDAVNCHVNKFFEFDFGVHSLNLGQPR